jgi:hypothetical protein
MDSIDSTPHYPKSQSQTFPLTEFLVILIKKTDDRSPRLVGLLVPIWVIPCVVIQIVRWTIF